MPSSVLNWVPLYHQLFPNNPLFPIEPKVFGCTCFIRDVHPQVYKLDSKSLKCIFWVTPVLKKGIDVIFLLYDDFLCLLMLHFLRLPRFPFFLLVLVRGRRMMIN